MNWCSEIFRKIHWDFDNPPFVEKIGDRFDPRSFVSVLKKAKVEAVCFFAKDSYGHAYYNTKIGLKHPGLKGDLLGKVTEICHHNNIRVLFYYIIGVDVRVVRQHPDWLQRRAPGDAAEASLSFLADLPEFPKICLNSPFIEEVAIPEVRELVGDYEPDGFFFDIMAQMIYDRCYCKYCQQAFKQKFRRDIPQDKDDPCWPDYYRWRRSITVEAERKLAETIHKIRTHVLVVSNHAYSIRHPETVPDYLDSLTLDVDEDEHTSLNCSLHARYLATTGKAFDVMNTRFIHWWGDWMVKPVATLKQELATIAANGGRCFIGDKPYPDGRLDKDVFSVIGEAFKFVGEREKFCRGAKPIPYIGIPNDGISN